MDVWKTYIYPLPTASLVLSLMRISGFKVGPPGPSAPFVVVGVSGSLAVPSSQLGPVH